jgi:hypothetical protein
MGSKCSAPEIARGIGDRGGDVAEIGNLGNAYAILGRGERMIGYYE